jgi:hypothetical protein
MSTETKTKKQNIINGLNYFIPFECGDDPAAWRQKDTVERIQKHLETVLPDDEDTKPPVTECDHMTGVEVGLNSARFVYASERLGNKPWTYCPKCGEKL